MNERVTFVSTFDDASLEKILGYVNRLDDKLCKVPVSYTHLTLPTMAVV